MKKLTVILIIIAFSASSYSQDRYTPAISWQEKLNKEYCSGLFNTPDATYFDLLTETANASSYLNILDWLQGRVAGLQIYTLRNSSRVPYIRNNRATVYVDEMPVDPGFLNVLPVADIAMIKVIKGPFAGSMAGLGGAIAMYTIKGDEGEEEDEESGDGK